MAEPVRVQVLMPREDADRFNRYCHDMGYKKSTLIARLVREHMDREGFHPQSDLFEDNKKDRGGKG